MRLKELRSSRGLGQKEVADALSCSVTVYSRYETGMREPSIDTLIRLADFYGVSLDELVGRTPMEVEVVEDAPPALLDDHYKITIKPDEKTPSADELERRIVDIMDRELKKRGL